MQPNGPLDDADTTHYEDVTLIPTISIAGFGCPCHGGQYDTEGNRTAGPPVRALDRYSFSIRNGHLFLGTPFSVSRGRRHRRDREDPQARRCRSRAST